MSALYLITFGKSSVESEDINQIVRALNGTDSTPIALTGVSDAAAYALSAQNSDAANGKAAIFYASDGTVLLDAKNLGVDLYKPGITDYSRATHTHVSDTTGGTIATGSSVGDITQITNHLAASF